MSGVQVKQQLVPKAAAEGGLCLFLLAMRMVHVQMPPAEHDFSLYAHPRGSSGGFLVLCIAPQSIQGGILSQRPPR